MSDIHIDNPVITPITPIPPFKFWVQQVLPSVYDDSLSYSELLNKVVSQLNTVIEATNTNTDNVDVLTTFVGNSVDILVDAYNTLASFVDEYFDNLDVQDEIDHKLDEMVESGALGTLLSSYVPPAVTDWLDEHPVQTAPPLDRTLSIQDYAADAKAVGDMFAKTMYNRGVATADIDHLTTPGWYRVSPDYTYTTLPSDMGTPQRAILMVFYPSYITTAACQILITYNNKMYYSFVTSDGRVSAGWQRVADDGVISPINTNIDKALKINGALSETTTANVTTAGWYYLTTNTTYTDLPEDYPGGTGLLVVWTPGATTAASVQMLISANAIMYISVVTSSGRASPWKRLLNPSDIPTVDKTLSIDNAAAEASVTGANVLKNANMLLMPSSSNLITDNERLYNFRVVAAGVTTTSTATTYITNPIPVKAGVEYKYYMTGSTFGSNAKYVAFYKTPWQNVSDEDAVITSTQPDENERYYTFTPTYDGWVRINASSSWSHPPIMSETSKWYNNSTKGTTIIVRNPLYEKSLHADGDSVMYGAINNGGYARIISEQNSMPYTNIAVGGGAISMGHYRADGTTPRYSVSESIDTWAGNKDYYIWNGGLNDYSLRNNATDPIHFGTQASLTDYNVATLKPTLADARGDFITAFEYICLVLATDSRFRESKYGYIFKHRGSTNSSEWYTTWKPAMINVMQKWGIPYLELDLLLPPIGMASVGNNAGLADAYTTDGDGTHPNTKAYEIFYAPKITEWLKTL